MRVKYINQEEFAKILAKNNDLSFVEAEKRVKEFLDTLEEGIKDEQYDGIQFVNLLTLRKQVRNSREGIIPKTGVKITIPDKIYVKATLGKKLDKYFNGNVEK